MSPIKSRVRKIWVVYPFFLAAFPVFALYYHNASEILPWVFVKPLIASLLLTALIFGAAKILLKDWHKAGLLTGLAILIIFSHGHIHSALAYRFENLFAQGQYKFFGWLSLGIDDILVSVWVLLFGIVFYSLWRTKRRLSSATKFMNFVAIFLFAVPAITSAVYKIGNIKPRVLQEIDSSIGQEIPLKVAEGAIKPDIYYIILDRYGGEKTIKDLYGFDNHEFLNFLTEKGFYVADQSTANYPRTLTSLASSLNMDYINFLADIAGENTSDQTFAYPLLNNHKVGELLKSQGYRYLHLGSWFEPTKVSPLADQNFIMGDLYLGIDGFSTELLETTLFAPIIRRLSSRTSSFEFDTQHRNRILYQFENLERIPPLDSPKFVFGHILLPHDPYVFGENCEELPSTRKISIPNYLAHVSCTNQKVTRLVETILASSKNPPIIVIQADEGPYNMKFPMAPGRFNFKDSSDDTLKERFYILNALYLPGVDTSDLYPAMTPVNTFRFIFNKYFGAELDLLPDKNYIYEDEDHFYKFIDVTDRLRR